MSTVAAYTVDSSTVTTWL